MPGAFEKQKSSRVSEAGGQGQGQPRESPSRLVKERAGEPVPRQPTVWSCLQENAELFRAETAGQSWKDYINYVDTMVLDEFENFIRKSLNYFIDNMAMDVSHKHNSRMDLWL